MVSVYPSDRFHCWIRTTSISTECSHLFLLLDSLQTKIPNKFTIAIWLVGSEVTVLLFWSLTPRIECSFLLLDSASLGKAVVLGRHVTELPQNQYFVYFCSVPTGSHLRTETIPTIHIPTRKATSTPVSFSGPLPHLCWRFPGFSPSILWMIMLLQRRWRQAEKGSHQLCPKLQVNNFFVLHSYVMLSCYNGHYLSRTVAKISALWPNLFLFRVFHLSSRDKLDLSLSAPHSESGWWSEHIFLLETWATFPCFSGYFYSVVFFAYFYT